MLKGALGKGTGATHLAPGTGDPRAHTDWSWGSLGSLKRERQERLSVWCGGKEETLQSDGKKDSATARIQPAEPSWDAREAAALSKKPTLPTNQVSKARQLGGGGLRAYSSAREPGTLRGKVPQRKSVKLSGERAGRDTRGSETQKVLNYPMQRSDLSGGTESKSPQACGSCQ